MPESLPALLVPGLACSPRLHADQIPALWRFGPVQVADHTRDERMEELATRILGAASTYTRSWLRSSISSATRLSSR